MSISDWSSDVCSSDLRYEWHWSDGCRKTLAAHFDFDLRAGFGQRRMNIGHGDSRAEAGASASGGHGANFLAFLNNFRPFAGCLPSFQSKAFPLYPPPFGPPP